MAAAAAVVLNLEKKAAAAVNLEKVAAVADIPHIPSGTNTAAEALIPYYY